MQSYSCFVTIFVILRYYLIIRRKDGALVVPITMNIAEIFREHLESRNARKEVKAAAMILPNHTVRLTSKGTCQFQVYIL